MTNKSVDDNFLSGLENLKTVGRYKIVKKLGQGGAAVVYLGRDPYIKRNVAVKISKPSDRYRESFFVEVQSTGRFNHPNIVTIYDAGVFDEYCYITMEYVEGVTLEDYCRPDNLLPISKVVEIIFSICQALDYAHELGVIHRDIKPSNIMLDKAGNPKITDFGIAVVTGETAPIGVFGTPSYMSPEQLKDETVGFHSDIFSIGCVLYELLTGQQAFSGNNNFAIMYKITSETPEPLKTLRPELPRILSDITENALAKDPKDRYQSCGDLAYELRVALRGLSGDVKNGEKLKDVVDYVHRVPFFASFAKEQVAELLAASNVIKVAKGKIIVSDGEIDDSFFIVLSGKTQVQKGDRVIASVGVGECFGEMSFICGQARSATVIASTECALLKISATLLDRSPESIQMLFYKNFARTLVQRISGGRKNSTQSNPADIQAKAGT